MKQRLLQNIPSLSFYIILKASKEHRTDFHKNIHFFLFECRNSYNTDLNNVVSIVILDFLTYFLNTIHIGSNYDNPVRFFSDHYTLLLYGFAFQ